jgi:uncharacterized membrane protein YcaP (DUF421 family)
MDIFIRATVIFFLLWAITRTTGKRELAEMSAFDLILLVIVGDLVQQGVTQDDRSITGAVIAVTTIAAWVIVFSYLSFRSKRVSEVMSGLPVVVVRDGQPLEHLLAGERLQLDDLAEAARSQGIGDLRDVRVGILEPDGQFSFVLFDGRIDQQRQHRKSVE